MNKQELINEANEDLNKEPKATECELCDLVTDGRRYWYPIEPHIKGEIQQSLKQIYENFVEPCHILGYCPYNTFHLETYIDDLENGDVYTNEVKALKKANMKTCDVIHDFCPAYFWMQIVVTTEGVRALGR